MKGAKDSVRYPSRQPVAQPTQPGIQQVKALKAARCKFSGRSTHSKNGGLPGSIDTVDLETCLAMSRPIVVINSMADSLSDVWQRQDLGK